MTRGTAWAVLLTQSAFFLLLTAVLQNSRT